MSTINPRVAAQEAPAPRSLPRPTRSAPEAPEAAPPTDVVQVSANAQAAIQHPLLDPGFQFLLGAFAAMSASGGATSASVNYAFNSPSSTHGGDQNLTTDPAKDSVVALGGGMVDGDATMQNTTVHAAGKQPDQHSFTFTEQYGSTKTELQIESSPERYSVKGNVAGVPVDLTTEGKTGMEGGKTTTTGTVGGKPYEMTFEISAAGNQARGSFDGRPIAKDYEFQMSEGGCSVSGGGQNGGEEQSLYAGLQLTP